MSYQDGAPPTSREAANQASSGPPTSEGSYKPLIDGSQGSNQSKSRKEFEYNAPATSNTWWWQHPDVRQNWKAVFGSIVMLIVGILLIAAGIVFEVKGQEHVACAVVIIIAFLFFVPGLYHTVYIYLAAKGMRGFEMNQLSIFTMSR